MILNEAKFIKECDIAFAALNKSYLNKMAFLLGWTWDDLRQEFRIVCWEIASGIGDFDPSKGSIQKYFIGRIRIILCAKNEVFLNLGINDKQNDEQCNLIDQFISEKSILDSLVEHEEQLEEEMRIQEEKETLEKLRALRDYLSMSQSSKPDWIRRLWHQGLTQKQIADIGGISQSTVSRSLKKEKLIYA